MLAVVAGLMASRYQPNPRVTVSGLTLGDRSERVEELLGKPRFRYRTESPANASWDYWTENKDRKTLSIEFENYLATRIEGGIPEIDGVDCSTWTAPQIVSKLGPPSHGGTGGEKGGKGHGFLAYPQYRLLVQQDEAGNHFILFKGSQK